MCNETAFLSFPSRFHLRVSADNFPNSLLQSCVSICQAMKLTYHGPCRDQPLDGVSLSLVNSLREHDRIDALWETQSWHLLKFPGITHQIVYTHVCKTPTIKVK